jgi:hypothetical protein
MSKFTPTIVKTNDLYFESIGPRANRNLDFLIQLSLDRSPKRRWSMINTASEDELMAVLDVCANVIRKRFDIDKKYRDRVKRHMENMKKLSRVRSTRGAVRAIQMGEGITINMNARRKRDRLKVQRGSGAFLPAVLLPVLLELVPDALEYLTNATSDTDESEHDEEQ